MISEEEFVEIIKELKKYVSMKEEIRKISRKYGADVEFRNGIEERYEIMIVELLEKIFNDTEKILSWWLWELDYGRKYESGCIREIDGSEIDLSTEKKLYKYLLDNRTDENRV